MTRTKTAVFAASETCLDSSVNDSEIVIPGFSVVRKDRNRNGGGVALFIRDNIPFNTRPDLNVDGLEAVWVELLLPRSKGILVSAMYKPPNDADFLSKLDSTLSKIDPGSEMYVLGDMNIDISSNSILSHRYKEVLASFGCEQLVAEPTRITPTTASIIDHIFTNMGEMVQGSGVVVAGFSDHLATFCSRKLSKQVFSGSVSRKIRSFRDYSKDGFNHELSKIDWSSVLLSMDVNYCLTEFNRLFSLVIDKVAPFKEVRVRRRCSPWMNPHILAGIRKRDSLFSRFRKDRGNEELYREYCKVRNSVQRDVKAAKEGFFRQGVRENKWHTPKNVNRNKKEIPMIEDICG